MKRWDPPQSKADAALAGRFILPKEADQIQDSIVVFKEMEKELIRNRSWDSKNIKFHATSVIMYLGERIDEARHDKEIERLLCCYHDDELVGSGE